MRAARTATTVLISAVLALGAAGCGGSEVEYQEVPGPPVTVQPPDDQSTLEGGSGSDDSAGADDGSATPTPTPETDTGAAAPTDQAGTDTAAAAPPPPPASDGTTDTDTGAGTDSGGSTAPAEPDGPSNDTAPPAGSEAEQFEAFCAENPGAC